MFEKALLAKLKLLLLMPCLALTIGCTEGATEFFGSSLFGTGDLRFTSTNSESLTSVINLSGDTMYISGTCHEDGAGILEWSLDDSTWSQVSIHGNFSGGDADCTGDDAFSFSVSSVGSIFPLALTPGMSDQIRLRSDLGGGVYTDMAYLTVDLPTGSPPTFSSFEIDNIVKSDFDEDDRVTFKLISSDLDGDTPVACAVSSPNNVNIMTSCSCNGAGECLVDIQGNPDFNGSGGFAFLITVSNGQNYYHDFATSIAINSINDAPTITGHTCTSSAIEDANYSCTINVADVDSTLATVVVNQMGSGGDCPSMAISGTGAIRTVSWTPTNTDVGPCNFRFHAFDGSDSSPNTNQSVSVSNTFSNFITYLPGSYTEDSGSQVVASDGFVQGDDEGEGLVYSLIKDATVPGTPCHLNGFTGPSDLTINSTTGEISFNPAVNFDQPCNIRVNINDGNGGSHTQNAIISSNPVNDPPNATSFTASPNATEDTTYFVNINLGSQYTDVDSGDMAETCTPSNPSAGINSLGSCTCITGNCTVSVTFDSNFSGSTTFDYVVNDGDANSALATVTLNVDAVNDPPVVTTSANDFNVAILHSHTFSIAGIDGTDADDGDNDIIFEIVTAPTQGQIFNVSTPINAGGTFTRADLVAGNVRYDQTVDKDLSPDFFEYALRDNDLAYAPTATVALPRRVNIFMTPYCFPYLTNTNYNDVGNGLSSATAYEICAPAQIQSIADNCNGGASAACTGFFKLMSNIDLTVVSGFLGIGDATNRFEGDFNGNGYSLSNLSMPTSQNYSGLFRYIGNNGNIYDLNLDSFNVNPGSGRTRAGILAGSFSGIISNVHVSGDVNSGGFVGGLVGEVLPHPGVNLPSITNSSADVAVVSAIAGSGSNAGGFIGSIANDDAQITESIAFGSVTHSGGIFDRGFGGFVGRVDGSSTVYRCAALGEVTADGERVGGFVGESTATSSSFVQSFSLGDATGRSIVGGFAGEFRGSILDSYSKGDATGVAGSGGVGGFIGSASSAMSNIINNYSTGDASGVVSTQGGFIGDLNGSPTITSTYWDNNESSQSNDHNLTSNHPSIFDESSTNMKLQGTYTGWNFSTVWAIDNDTNDEYPFLINNPPPPKFKTADVMFAGDFHGVAYGLVGGSVETYVAVGELGAIYHSIDDVNDFESWNPSSPSLYPTYQLRLRAVTFGTGGGEKFVAVGDGGGITTSTNGISGWTQQSPAGGFNGTFWDITWDGTHFVAVGDGGEVQYSSDGITWNQVSPTITANDLYAIVSINDFKSTGNAHYVAVGQNGNIWGAINDPTSSANWSQVTAAGGFTGRFFGVAYLFNSSAGAENFVAVGEGGQTQVIDGDGVTIGSMSAIQRAADNSYTGDFKGVFSVSDSVAAGGENGEVQVMDDGINWRKEPIGSGYSGTFYDAEYDLNNTIVLVGQNGSIIVHPNVAGGGGPSESFDTGYNITGLSYTNSSFTVTNNATGMKNVRSTNAHSSGQHYFEFVIDNFNAGDHIWIGVGEPTYPTNGQYIGQNTNGWGCRANFAQCQEAGLASGNTIGNFSANGTNVGVAVNLDTGKVYYRLNGGAWENGGTPGGGEAGFIFGPGARPVSGNVHAMGTVNNTGQQISIKLHSNDLSYSPPSGYMPWDNN